MHDIKTPTVVNDFYTKSDYEDVFSTAMSFDKTNWVWEEGSGRYTLRNRWTDKLGIVEINRAREIFDSKELLFTYSLLTVYNNTTSKLHMHKDDNACTYTIDICIKCKEPWPLTIEGKDYIAKENDAICFYGNDQLHGRPPFSDGNSVMVLFLHYVEKDHWWFKKSNKECV